MIVTDPTLANSPPLWSACNTALSQFTPVSKLGFVGSPGDVHRFRSRYRLAESFKGIVLDTYTAETTGGYSVLFRVFLTWSAFEQLLEICGLTLPGVAPLLEAYEPEAAAASVRGVVGHEECLRFVYERLDRATHRANVEAFLKNEPCNALNLPAGIRHIFSHGNMTPHSGARNPNAVEQVSAILCDFLFRIMDGEFERRLREHGVAAALEHALLTEENHGAIRKEETASGEV